MILHYIALHCITLHYITLHYITLHLETSPFVLSLTKRRHIVVVETPCCCNNGTVRGAITVLLLPRLRHYPAVHLVVVILFLVVVDPVMSFCGLLFSIETLRSLTLAMKLLFCAVQF